MRKSSFFLLRSIQHGISSQTSRSLFLQTRRSLYSLGTSDRNLKLFPFNWNNNSSNNISNNNHHQQQQNLDFSSLHDSSSTPAPSSLSTTTSGEEEKRNRLGVEIISIKHVKPAIPTPHHLKIYELPILDQIILHVYMPFVYFYLNNDQNGSQQIDHNIILKRRLEVLKQSLSETLTRFYPLAGKVQETLSIDCNDDGVYYVEAKVDDLSLSDFLNNPDNKSMHELLPFDPSSMELRSKTYVIMAQTTIFKCGGMAIGYYASHKIMDGHSHAEFLKAWAATARGALGDISRNFIAPSIFLPDPTMPANAMLESFGLYPEHGKTVTKRLVFGASSLMDLKQKAQAPSRVMAVTGLIWKCAMDASRKKSSSDGSDPKSSILILPVNLRGRSVPPLPSCSIGNLVWMACTPYEASDEVRSLSSTVRLLKNEADKINTDFIEKMKGEDGPCTVRKYLKEMKTVLSQKNAELIAITSMCNSGIYEADFGWGNPVWASVGDADADVRLLGNLVYLMDTRSGDGIEAWVTLGAQEMANFVQDADILAYVSLDPCPLQV